VAVALLVFASSIMTLRHAGPRRDLRALAVVAPVLVCGQIALGLLAVTSFLDLATVEARRPPAAGATLLYLPPYSPDFNPIEMAFAKLKALLRKAAPRTVTDLWDALGSALDDFPPTACRNYFADAGYDPD